MPRHKNGLSLKQSAFVREYMIDLNASAAARRAGYSPKTAFRSGQQNMQKAAVRSAIDAEMAARAARNEISADFVLESIKRIAGKAEAADEHTAALKGHELLGKHLKLFTEKLEHSGKVETVEIVIK